MPSLDRLDSDIHNADANLHVRFYNFSKDAANPDTHIEIITPGDTTNIIDRRPGEGDKKRFMRQWLAYQAESGNAELVGTPLEMWQQERPLELTDGQLMELKILKFQTVEQVAQASDRQCQKVGMGGEALRVKAIAYLAAKNGQIVSNSMAKTNDEVATLKNQVAELTALLSRQMQAAPVEPKRRGPKPGYKRKTPLNVQHPPATGATGSQ